MFSSFCLSSWHWALGAESQDEIYGLVKASFKTSVSILAAWNTDAGSTQLYTSVRKFRVRLSAMGSGLFNHRSAFLPDLFT